MYYATLASDRRVVGDDRDDHIQLCVVGSFAVTPFGGVFHEDELTDSEIGHHRKRIAFNFLNLYYI